MKRRSARAALLLATAAALVLGSAGPASATMTCTGGNTESVCQPLVTCLQTGAVIFVTSSPVDAAAYFRNCIALDRRYRIHKHSSGADHAHTRKRRKRTTRSTFWPLYCEAQRRAGARDSDPICQLRAPASRSGRGERGGRRGGGGDTGGRRGSGRDPQFTG